MEIKNFKKRELNPAQFLVIGFASIILLGTFLLNLPIATMAKESAGLINSFFTATSSVCVTGLTVVDTGTYWSTFGKTVILLLIQIGGLGFMSVATLVAFIMGRKISLKNRLIMQEELNYFSISGIVRLMKYIFMITLIIEGIGAILLSVFFIPIYGISKGIIFGIFHSVSAFCNAGFDLIGNGVSFTPFVTNSYFSLVIITLVIMGGLGFSVLIDINKNKRLKKISLHSKLVIVMTISLLIIGFVLFLALEFDNPNTLGQLNFGDKLVASFFQSVTTRTAGFNTVDTAALEDSSKIITMVLMFIGGAPGSTAGGIKITTIAILILTILSVAIGREDVQVFRRRINKETISRALTIFLSAIFVVTLVTLLLTITEEGNDFLDVFFETISAFGTVGLSAGLTPNLSSIGKIIVALMMFSGRLGPFTIIVALAYRKKKKDLFHYPEGKISVG